MGSLIDLDRRLREERSGVLVVNTHSRRGARAYAQARQLLEAGGITLAASYPVARSERLPEVVRAAIGNGHALVVVGGGDGTISAVVDEFAYRDVALGLLPLGTGNSFARSLGIPLSLEGAVDVIVKGRVAEVDLGRIGNDYFANVASLGFLGDVARHTSDRLKHWLGPLAYVAAAAMTFVRHRPFQCEIRTAQALQRVRTHQVVIANGSFLGTSFVPQLRPDDASLVVYTMDMLNRWELVPFWMAFASGRFRRHPRARYFRTRRVRIDTDPPQQPDVDGEPNLPCASFEVTLAQQALRIMAPLKFERERKVALPLRQAESPIPDAPDAGESGSAGTGSP